MTNTSFDLSKPIVFADVNFEAILNAANEGTADASALFVGSLIAEFVNDRAPVVDIEAAFRMAEMGHRGGDPLCSARLAVMVAEKVAVPSPDIDVTKIISPETHDWLVNEVDNNLYALMLVGLLHQHGIGPFEHNLVRARNYLEKAVQFGEPYSAYYLGLTYASRDRAQALKFLGQAADSKNVEAMFHYAMHIMVDGMLLQMKADKDEKQIPKAPKAPPPASAKLPGLGGAPALPGLGGSFGKDPLAASGGWTPPKASGGKKGKAPVLPPLSQGAGLPLTGAASFSDAQKAVLRDRGEAKRLLDRGMALLVEAADKEYLPALFQIGKCYALGVGVPKDDGQSLEYIARGTGYRAFEDDVSNIYPPALLQLAELIQTGQGLEQHEPEALRMFLELRYREDGGTWKTRAPNDGEKQKADAGIASLLKGAVTLRFGDPDYLLGHLTLRFADADKIFRVGEKHPWTPVIRALMPPTTPPSTGGKPEPEGGKGPVVK